MAKVSRGLAAALSVCVLVLAASPFRQPDIMKDYSGVPPWLAFEFALKVKLSKQLRVLTMA